MRNIMLAIAAIILLAEGMQATAAAEGAPNSDPTFLITWPNKNDQMLVQKTSTCLVTWKGRDIVNRNEQLNEFDGNKRLAKTVYKLPRGTLDKRPLAVDTDTSPEELLERLRVWSGGEVKDITVRLQ